MNDEIIAVPQCQLVIGGGPGTINSVYQNLKEDRPAVVVPESGGAAEAIYSVCYEDERTKRPLATPEEVCRKHGWADPETVRMMGELVRLNKEYSYGRDVAISHYRSDGTTMAFKDVLLDMHKPSTFPTRAPSPCEHFPTRAPSSYGRCCSSGS